MLKYINELFISLFKLLLLFKNFIDARSIGLGLSIVVNDYFFFNFEYFMLVILCKYNLGPLRFAIAKWFFCSLFCFCLIEANFGLLHLVDWMYFSFISDPGLPKDLQVLSYKTKNFVDSVDSIETTHDFFNNHPSNLKEDDLSKVPKRPYICACALFILYWGICVANSGA